MSILIKGLKMPKKGTCIDIVILDDGTVVCYDEDDKKIGEAVELPDHGNLIDRDSLKTDLGITDWECNKCQWGGLFGCKRDDFSDACFFLENAPVVIPAERSEE